jgi:uncharacterized membrane protein
MIDNTWQGLAVAAAVGTGTVGGVFFAFSTFVMSGLGRLRPPEGIAAMQRINEDAPRPAFMSLFLGTALVCVVLAISTVGRLDDAPAVYELVGSVLYLTSIVLTGVYHVPRNDALARVVPDNPGAAVTWQRYLDEWVRWNHVRTLASISAAVLLTLSLLAG